MGWWNSINEMIYTTSEVSAAGWTSGAGFISNIRFNIAGASSYVPQAGSTVSIYLDNTMDATLPSVPVPGGTNGTLVWTGTHPLFNVTGWWNFTLPTSFCYAGGNLYVRVVRTDFAYGSGPSWYYTSTGSTMTRYKYWDSGSASGSMTATTSRPNVQLVFNTGTAMSYTSSTTTQTNNNPTGAGQFNQEILGMQVVTSGCSTPLAVTSFTLNTAGSTNAADIASAKVFYTGNSSTFSSALQFGSAVANPSGSFTVTGTQNLGFGTNYFWLAYDVAASATNGNVLDAQCSSITVGGVGRTPSVTNPSGSRPILAPLSGIYTINPTGSGSRNFTSFTAAINTAIAVGIGGATTFQVAAGTYNEQLSVPPLSGASSTNTVTFDGGTGNAASRIISYNVTTSGGSVITLNGADYLRFRNLTVNSTNASIGYGIYFTNLANYNEITECVINMPANSTSTSHICIVASAVGGHGSSGDWANYNLIQNNTLNGGYYCVHWYGSSSSSLTTNVGNQFIGNTIQDWYYYGIYMYYGAETKINKNRIEQRRTGSFTSSGGYGLYFYYQNNGPEIIGNYVSSANYGIRTYYMNQYNSSTTIRGKVYNNMIIGNGTSTIYASYMYYPRYTDFVYNSIYSKTTGSAYGLYHANSTTSYQNVVKNNYVVHEGIGTWYPVYTASVTNFSEYDYNAFYRFGAGTDQYYWNGTYYTSFAALQAATTTVHDNSVYGNPYYYSQTDLHSNSHVGYQAGQAFAAVTDDFDGQPRGTSPCIGADEYPAPPPEYDVAVAEVMLNTAETKWAHNEGAAEHAVRAVVENTGLSANPTSLTVTYKVGSMPASSLDGVQQTFTPGWVGKKAAIEFTQKVSGFVAATTPVVYAKVFWASDQDPVNDGAMDNAYIEIAKVHGIENFEKMEADQYPLTRDPGLLDLPWTIIDNNGGSTLAVYPGAGNGGNGLAMYAPTEAADEWVVTPAADLLAAASYRFGFDFRNWGGAPVTIQLAWGNTPDPTQMSVFATYANIMPGGFVNAKMLGGGFDPYFNTPFYTGAYYIAMRFTTSGTNAYFSVDNLKLDDNPSPPPKIAFGLPGADLSTYIDNPFVKITLLANYKLPGIINRTYEVQNKINIYGLNGDFLWDVETSTPWIKLTKETPNPTLQGYNLTPPRPRQFQTFTMSVNPSGLAPGTHMGAITFYGILFNNDFPPPASGLVATNEPLTIAVELIITTAGSKTGTSAITQTISTPLTVPGSPYNFVDPNTGDPIATVEVTSGQIATMTITAFPNQLPQNLQRKLFVKRYWQIQHTGSGWTANVTFPYADIEASMITDKMQLRGVRQAVMLGAWEDPIMGTSSASDPMTNSVKVHDFNEWNIGGNIALSHPYFVAGKSSAGVPETFGLEQNYPNPFNPTTSIVFTVAEERAVRLAVYNGLGAEVAELVNDVLPAGRYEVTFDASDLPSGTYIYRMLAGEFTATQRMTLSK
jgi:hypothetical protein